MKINRGDSNFLRNVDPPSDDPPFPRESLIEIGVCAEGETSFPLSGPSNLLLLFPLCVCCTFDADEIVI